MLVSGVVIHLERDEVRARAALEQLGRERGLELGEAADWARVPAVLETSGSRAGREAVEGLERTDGVVRVDVVFVGVDSGEGAQPWT